MWHPSERVSISSRSSARNIDVFAESAAYEERGQPNGFPPNTEMWATMSAHSRRTTTSTVSESDIEPESLDPDLLKDQRPLNASLPIEAWEQPQSAGRELVLEQRSPSGVTQFSHSTLAENELLRDDTDLKTPRVFNRELLPPSPGLSPTEDLGASGIEEEQKRHVGPLQKQLLSLLATISTIEQEQPTVMASTYMELEHKVAALEAEKATWLIRHEALYALRDEDLANLIKVRGLLAKERQDHDALRTLRDEDLQNVIHLREKLARATWAAAPHAPVTTSIATAGKRSNRSSRAEGNVLWQAAKMAAMEQRVLELERHNTELRTQLEHAQTVQAEAQASMHANFQIQPQPNNLRADATEADGTFRGRERLVVKIERLRTENEGLRREVDRQEDAYMELEQKMETLQRRLGLMHV